MSGRWKSFKWLLRLKFCSQGQKALALQKDGRNFNCWLEKNKKPLWENNSLAPLDKSGQILESCVWMQTGEFKWETKREVKAPKGISKWEEMVLSLTLRHGTAKNSRFGSLGSAHPSLGTAYRQSWCGMLREQWNINGQWNIRLKTCWAVPLCQGSWSCPVQAPHQALMREMAFAKFPAFS